MPRKSAGSKISTSQPTYLCPYCNKIKKASDFYTSSDPLVMTGKTSMCKSCAEKIARNWNERTQTFGDCTKGSVQEALERLDKPWIDNLWDSSYFEYVNDQNTRQTNIWGAYIKNVGMPQYRGLRWKDGDLFTSYVEDAKKVAALESDVDQYVVPKDQEINEEYEKNRKDVIKLLGYDPFEKELDDDKPLLYSQLIGYLDLSGEGNEDMMRTSSAITIVRGFLQQSKIDDKIAKSMANVASNNNAGEIKTFLDSKQKISSTISQLAEQSCLSLKYNKNASKGENTWTGKIKKLKDLNLREAEVNGFDLGTCKGMQQVLELSDSSIMRQLRLDESEWSDMVADQRQMLVSVQNERDIYKEINRILLRENLDLRDTLEDNNLLDIKNLQDLKELFSAFGETNAPQEEDEDE